MEEKTRVYQLSALVKVLAGVREAKLHQFRAMADEVLAEIKEDKFRLEAERRETVQCGCRHDAVELREGIISGEKFLVCKICYQKF